MKTKIELTSKDKNNMSELNEANEWGLHVDELLELVGKHIISNDYDKALIEYRLEDINFHAYNRLISKGLYDEVFYLIEKDYIL